ncbi:MAG: hypothetical protein Q7K44_03150 [Candidatus Liptonbacteria bacterium]|nr:hypothetical protein [Candidatus Liptonbacteria bacterium]
MNAETHSTHSINSGQASSGQSKTCFNCRGVFTIQPEDFQFYNKIGVPPPTRCPACREQRRLAHRNMDYFLRDCDKCGKKSISIWHTEIKGYVFYCNECFWADDWDGLQYGREFDFSRPFFEQFNELYKQVPKHMSNSMFNTNSDYVVNAREDKDCYLGDEMDLSVRSMYGYAVQRCVDCVDCHYINDCEIGYELVKCERCYACFYCFDSHNCNNSAFLAGCRGVSNSLFCTNLRNVKNHLFNKPVTSEEIKKMRDKIFSGSHETFQKALKDYQDLRNKSFVKQTIGTNIQNSTGSFLADSKNCVNCFSVDNSINCKYCVDIHYSKESMDVNLYECELSYDSLHAGPKGYKNIFSHMCWYCSDVTYADDCHNSEDLFACAGLKKKKYCIFNRQYDEVSYKELKARIIAHMEKTGEWGEYFPIELSPHGYNHTFAQEFYPLTEKEVLEKGWRWLPEINIGEKYKLEKETFILPDKISETEESVCKEILKCEATGRFYRIHPQEYRFLKKYGLPLPRLSPKERDHRRWEQTKPRKLWNRQCSCDYEIYKNSIVHKHHPDGRCPNNFEAAYSPDSLAIVYCESCYNREVV